jgi:hypothetical protein
VAQREGIHEWGGGLPGVNSGIIQFININTLASSAIK